MEKTATFTRWLCYSHTKDGFRTSSGYTKDANKAKVYIRKPSPGMFGRSLKIVPVKIECVIDLEALTYTKISGNECT